MGGSTIFIFAGLGWEERERFLHHEGELQQKSSASLAHPATELLIMGMQVLAMVKIK
jgi:hypothetical protein